MTYDIITYQAVFYNSDPGETGLAFPDEPGLPGGKKYFPYTKSFAESVSIDRV